MNTTRAPTLMRNHHLTVNPELQSDPKITARHYINKSRGTYDDVLSRSSTTGAYPRSTVSNGSECGRKAILNDLFIETQEHSLSKRAC
jgi:hypothetical protein